MPTAGFSIDPKENKQEQIMQIHQQMHSAEEVSCAGIIHFIGPKIPEDLEQTSYWAACRKIK